MTDETTTDPNNQPNATLRVVTMRVDSASLLVDNVDKYITIGSGIVLNISFFQDATSENTRKAVRKLLRLPLLSRGKWGDEHEPESILDLCSDDKGVDVLIVPQANLVGKAASRGASIRYTDQADKELAKALYNEFCTEITMAAKEALAPPPAKTKEQIEEDIKERRRRNAQHPKNMFQLGGEFGEAKYTKFDERGVPTHDANGEPLAKSAKKKCEKLFKGRMQKYEKAMARKAEEEEEQDGKLDGTHDDVVVALKTDGLKINEDESTANTNQLDRKCADSTTTMTTTAEDGTNLSLPRVYCGVFGNRQGFRCESSGPTIHCLDL